LALAATGALPAVLRRSLLESIMSAEGEAAIKAQNWDSRLAVGIVALLASWTRDASSVIADSAWADDSDTDDDDSPSRKAPIRASPASGQHPRTLLFSLACPLEDMDTAALNDLARYAAFVSAALPPTYRRFDSTSEQTAAEHAAMRRGMGEASRLSQHHRLALAVAKAMEEKQSRSSDPADSIAFAPYDDNPAHRPTLVDPLMGATTTTSFPEWLEVSVEDVARMMLILKSNAFTDAGTAPTAQQTAVVAARHWPGQRRAGQR
jgi:hypothetical protein